jgi:hypothetical protein
METMIDDANLLDKAFFLLLTNLVTKLGLLQVTSLGPDFIFIRILIGFIFMVTPTIMLNAGRGKITMTHEFNRP